MKKRNIVAANWKLNPETLEEAKKIFNATRDAAKGLKNTDVIVCPPYPFVQPLAKLNRPKNLFLGSQNISAEQKGAFTGEVSGGQILDTGAKYSIIGHSERLKMGETTEQVKRKLQMAFDIGLTPILCIGEKERDKEGTYLAILKNQIKEYLTGLQKKDLVGIIIAYEPIWAIGKSWREAMSPTDIHETTLFIKKVIGENFGKDIAAGAKILYGGSVEGEGAEAIMEYGNIEGFLVGHASLKPAEFAAILKAADKKK